MTDNKLFYLNLINFNLSNILNRVPIVNILYARNEEELKDGFIDHIDDIIRMIIEDDDLLNEMLLHISNTNIIFPKNELKNWLRELNIEMIDSDDDVQNNILTINNYIIYFNSENNMRMIENTQNNVLNRDDTLLIFEELTNKYNLFNMDLIYHTIQELDMSENVKLRFLQMCVNNTIQYIFFELLNKFSEERSINNYFNQQTNRIIYGMVC